MTKFFYYKHPKTGEIFSDQRMIGFEGVPYKADGVECELLKDYVLDLINSSQVRNYYAYDKVKLEALSNEFNKGDKSCFNQIDWWLSFELFRRRIMNNKKIV